MESNERYYRRRAVEERMAAQRAMTEQARAWHAKLAADFAERAAQSSSRNSRYRQRTHASGSPDSQIRCRNDRRQSSVSSATISSWEDLCSANMPMGGSPSPFFSAHFCSTGISAGTFVEEQASHGQTPETGAYLNEMLRDTFENLAVGIPATSLAGPGPLPTSSTSDRRHRKEKTTISWRTGRGQASTARRSAIHKADLVIEKIDKEYDSRRQVIPRMRTARTCREMPPSGQIVRRPGGKSFSAGKMARPERFERPTLRFVV